MNKTKLLKIFLSFFTAIICVNAFTRFVYATKHPTESCYSDATCDGACVLPDKCTNVGEANCEAGFPWACYDPNHIGSGAVNIGRDFIVGSVPVDLKSGFENLSSVLSSILPNVYIIAGVILLFLMIGAGFAIISSNNDPQKKGQGGKALTAAITGFLLLFASYWIVQIIERVTGVPILNLSGLGI